VCVCVIRQKRERERERSFEPSYFCFFEVSGLFSRACRAYSAYEEEFLLKMTNRSKTKNGDKERRFVV